MAGERIRILSPEALATKVADLDADPASDLRVAQDARHAATIADAVEGKADAANVYTKTVIDTSTAARKYEAVTASIRSRGALCIHLDDGQINQYTIGAPIAESYGGRLTFAICAGYSASVAGTAIAMSHAQIRDLAARGHEIANHTQTHTNMTTQTAAQRLVEWDTSRAYIEGTIGVPTSSFVLPFSVGNPAIYSEAVGRYGRVFAGSELPYMQPPADLGTGLVQGRFSWATTGGTGQALMLNMIRRAAASGSVLTAITHSVDGSDGANGVTTAEFTEAIALAASLGMAITTARDALPEPIEFPDYGLEDATLRFWTPNDTNANNTITGGVTDSPLTGLVGTKSMRISSTDGANVPYALSKLSVPVMSGDEHTFSCQVHQQKTSGVNGAYAFVREYDSAGALLATTNSNIPTAVGSTGWMQLKASFTPNKLTRSVKVGLALGQIVGDGYFDHLHFGPTRYGVRG